MPSCTANAIVSVIVFGALDKRDSFGSVALTSVDPQT